MTKKNKKKKKKRPATLEERLKDAATWVRPYTKKLVVKKYLKKYGVSLKDCVRELAMLGRPDPHGDLRNYNRWKSEKREARRARKAREREPQETTELWPELDWLVDEQARTPLDHCYWDPEPPFSSTDWDPRKKKAVRRLGDLRRVRWAKDAKAIFEPDYCEDEVPF